jgi:hypothetical protein
MKKFLFAVLILFSISALAVSFFGQTKKPVKKNTRTPAATPTPESSPTVEPQTINKQAKKNERPTNGNSTNKNTVQNGYAPNYFYEFSRPGFIVEKILIEHDEAGKGKISFVKSISSEVITDPIQVSPAALERIKNALAALDFMNSTESYQYEKDYSHLGNIIFKVKKDGKVRETKFNWTTNADAKTLMDEYRRIGNQYVWMFDMNLSRANQPLESPKLMNLIDNYIRRNEVSDAAQLIPFLKELGDDERIPLIARNHATRLVKQIEKNKENEK